MPSLPTLPRRRYRPRYLLAAALACAVLAEAAAQHALRLTDEDGEALYGVNAYTPDFAFAASSDLDGLVDAPELRPRDTLVLSYTGYTTLRLSGVELRRRLAGVPRGRALTLSLKPASALLEEAVVVGRTDEVAGEIPWTVAMITEEDIARVNPQTTADALEASGEVFVQRSQMGGGSPVVRGFEANRILLVVDGVRLNNAIYRSGHLQSAITVDPAMLDRVEVLFGAGSLLYGSDALGGVVHFRTREPRLALDGAASRNEGHFFTRFSSANLEKTAHVDYNLGRRKWASQTSVSVSSFDDLRAGARYNHAATDFGRVPYFVADAATGEVRANPDPYVQRGTGYDQVDLLQKFKWRLGDERYLLVNAQFSNSSRVPRFDRLTQVAGDGPRDLKFAEWYYGPQRRVFGSARLVSSAARRLHDRAQWIAAHQRIDEDRYDRKLDNMWRTFSLVDVDVSSLTFDADKYLGPEDRHRVSYGFEVQHNDVRSLGGRVHLIDESVLFDEISRYPSGGARMTSGGAYATYRYSGAADRFHVQAGARYSAVRLAATFGDPDNPHEPVDWPAELRDGMTSTNAAPTVALGFTVEPTPSTSVQALGSTAFRSPNVDDFAKMRVKNGFVSVPNVDLAPERARNAELTLTQRLRRLGGPGFAAQVSATAFVSQIDDVIVRRDGALPNGDTAFVSGGETYRVQVNDNADRGLVRGLGLRFDATYGERLDLGARVTWTRGRATDADGAQTPLAHIPPAYGQVTADYRLGKATARAAYRFNGAKAWDDYAPAGSSDNEDQAIAGVGTPAWEIVDVYLDYAFAERFTAQVGLENVTDLHYRPFSSGVSAPGRNVVVSVRGRF